jgi:26S proteasome regulatory subunit N1
VDSARGNLAGTFVNAFVNAGFGNDKLMVNAEEGNSWIYKNKDHGTFALPRTNPGFKLTHVCP